MALAAVFFLVLPPLAQARHFLVGFDEDSLEWGDTQAIVARGRTLEIESYRVTLSWQRGELKPTATDHYALSKAVSQPRTRIVLAVYGRASDAPRTVVERSQYCGFVARALDLWPQIRDVVIWNEVNKRAFWHPTSAAAYERLLATCYDKLHAGGRRVNVVTSLSPHFGGSGLSPQAFIERLGVAYRASHRRRPLFDTWGQNVYDTSPLEPASAVHAGGTIAIGDYDKLLLSLRSAFFGTGQTLPSRAHPSIWYLEDGFQTRIDPSKAALYHGRENAPLLAVVGLHSQATQLVAALHLAYCQPAVGAFFNFMMADESDLTGWQSGLYWTDWTPKPSYAPLRAYLLRLHAGLVSC